ncbi:MAG: ATPase domain-containing protein, partial [Candidatus Lutacidiplasmatales archaeon]
EPSPVAAAPAPVLPADLVEREQTVVRWLTDLLDRMKSDRFDPSAVLQELQEINRQLFEERAKRKQLEDEVEHVKRGSVAVIKYVRAREAKARDQAIQAKDAEIAEMRLRLLSQSAGGGAASEATEGLLGPDGSLSPVSADVPAMLREQIGLETERRLREEFATREGGYVERETELRRRLVQAEGEVRSLRGEAESLRSRGERPGEAELPAALKERLSEADQRERELILRENELRTKFEEIRIAAQELDRKSAPMAYKEKELAAFEQQLQTTRQALELEARRQEKFRAEIEASAGQPSEVEAKRLEDLQQEVDRREQEMIARETLVNQRLAELEVRQKASAEDEAGRLQSDASAVINETKVRSGVRRLDDLLYGGLPLASQVLVNAGSHTGKEILARLFIAEGLKSGVGALWVVTDRTFNQIREEMTLCFPGYPEAEKKGMVRYVDLYSRSLGSTQGDTGVRLLSPNDKGVLDQLNQGVNQYSQELKETFKGYRLVFESVSTITAYLDTAASFRFLQPFIGRRKLEGAPSYFLIESGMHTESDLQSLEHMMDGSINLKIEQLKTILSVKGIGEVQSRAWIGYQFTKKSFSLGSFSLDHIR